MSYINVGAYVNGKRPRYKKNLIEAFKADPASVEFDKTAVLFNGSGSFDGDKLDELPEGTTALVVAGPDPFVDRSWFANVVKDPKKGWIVK